MSAVERSVACGGCVARGARFLGAGLATGSGFARATLAATFGGADLGVATLDGAALGLDFLAFATVLGFAAVLRTFSLTFTDFLTVATFAAALTFEPLALAFLTERPF